MMVKLIAGEKGTGKTRKMIGLANEHVNTGKGNVVFLDNDGRKMYDIRHEIRLVSLSDYPINSVEALGGFLSGIISRDHDIEVLFIDSLKFVELENLVELLKILEVLANKFEIEFVISVGCKENEVPKMAQEYIIR